MVNKHHNITAWLAEHPNAHRALYFVGTTYALCLWAVVAAPTASAAVGSAALGWTGLHDTDGVPLAAYFLSTVDAQEYALNNGQHVSAIDPTTWVSWTAKAIQGAVWHSTVAWWLTNEAALMLALLGFALWLLRFSMSSAWLVALAQVGRPVYAAVRTLAYNMMLGPIAITICLICAGWHWQHGRPARAYNLAGSAAILAGLTFTLFKNPIDDLASDHGLLGMARQTGFQIAQDVRGSSYAPGRSLEAQLDAWTAQLVSNTARPMVQIMNFGTVIDEISPGCRRAWNAAILASNGSGPDPAHAMKTCGAPQALVHAQQLGANDFLLGFLFSVACILIALFVAYVGLSTLLLGAKTTYYCIVGVPAVLLGMTGWSRAKTFAHRCVAQVLLHGAQMIIFTVFLALSGVAMATTLTGSWLGHGGMTVVPRMMLLAIGALVGMWLFHYIDKHFYTESWGTIGHQLGGAWNTSSGAVRDEWGDLVSTGRRGRHLLHRRRGDTEDDEAVGGDDAAEEPLPGLDVVKPRSHRGPRAQVGTGAVEVGAEDIAATEARTAVVEGAVTAGRAAAGTAAAEGAAAVAAPEVVLPLAVGESVVHHVRGRGKKHTEKSPESTQQAGVAPDTEEDDRPAEGLPAVERRPERRDRHDPSTGSCAGWRCDELEADKKAFFVRRKAAGHQGRLNDTDSAELANIEASHYAKHRMSYQPVEYLGEPPPEDEPPPEEIRRI